MKMTKIITLILCLSLIGGSVVINSCKKDEKKTTGHLYVIVKFPETYNANGCCSDPSQQVYDIHVDVKTIDYDNVITVNGNNNATIDCGELLPGLYLAESDGKYATLYDQSGNAPCGNCGGYPIHNGFESESIQIIANEDKTITLGP